MGCVKLATLRECRMDIGDFVLASVCIHLPQVTVLSLPQRYRILAA